MPEAAPEAYTGGTFMYGVLIPVSEIRQCLEEWDGR